MPYSNIEFNEQTDRQTDIFLSQMVSPSGSVWSSIALYGPVRPHMVQYGPVVSKDNKPMKTVKQTYFLSLNIIY